MIPLVQRSATQARRGRRAWLFRGGSVLTAVIGLSLGLTLLLRPATPAMAAPAAPLFSLPVIAGGHGTLSLSALRGHPVVLNFFQSDCGPCIDEMATLARTARAYKARGIVVVAVSSLGDAPDAARRLAVADHLPFPVVWDNHQDVAWHYGVAATPTSMFVDAQGRLRGQYVGQLDTGLVRDGLAQAGAIACQGCAPVESPFPSAAPPTIQGGTALRVSDTAQKPYRAAAAFALRDQRGQLITPASLRGKVVALTFLSALCTQQCPLVGQELSQARRLLGRDAARLVIVAVSVAPEQDNPGATRRFARKSGWEGTDWHYLTAPRATLARVWKAYYVYVQAPPPIFKVTGADLVHQAGLYLIDPQGRLRAYDDVPFLASDVASSVRTLLAPSN